MTWIRGKNCLKKPATILQKEKYFPLPDVIHPALDVNKSNTPVKQVDDPKPRIEPSQVSIPGGMPSKYVYLNG